MSRDHHNRALDYEINDFLYSLTVLLSFLPVRAEGQLRKGGFGGHFETNMLGSEVGEPNPTFRASVSGTQTAQEDLVHTHKAFVLCKTEASVLHRTNSLLASGWTQSTRPYSLMDVSR